MFIVQRLRVVHFRPSVSCKPSSGEDRVSEEKTVDEEVEGMEGEEQKGSDGLAWIRGICQGAGRGAWVKRV